VEPNKVYKMKVRAKNSAGYGGFTDEISVTTPAEISAPLNLAAKILNPPAGTRAGDMVLTW